MLDGKPLDAEPAKLEHVIVPVFDLRAVEAVFSAARPDVRKDAVHSLLCLLHRVARQHLADTALRAPVRPVFVRVALDPLTIQRVEAPDVVKASYVVHVRVREDYRVDTVNPVLDARLAHLGGSVDQEPDVA